MARDQAYQSAETKIKKSLLKKEDSANGFGGLVRVQNKRREFLSVHPKFVSEY